MKILVFSWRDPKHPKAGGAEQVMHEHIKGWIEAGHEITFFSSRPKGVVANETLDGVKIIRKGSQYVTTHILAFFWYLFGKHETFDLVVDQFHGWPFFTPLYVGPPKLAVIQEITREVWLKYRLPFGLNYILGPLGYFVEPMFFLFYRKIPFMTGSQSAKDDLIKMGIPSKNINIVPHGVIIQEPPKNIKKLKTKTIVFFGALTKDKGIEDALRCFSLLNKSGNYIFWVIGKPESEEYLDFLRNKSKKLGISKKIIFWGFVSQEKKFELLKKAHIMVNPSVREGWGLVNIEANAMGTPVVAYHSAGLIDSVLDKKTGLITKSNTPKELAKLTEGLLNEDRTYKTMQGQAKKWAKKFSWQKSKNKSKKLITSLILDI